MCVCLKTILSKKDIQWPYESFWIVRSDQKKKNVNALYITLCIYLKKKEDKYFPQKTGFIKFEIKKKKCKHFLVK